MDTLSIVSRLDSTETRPTPKDIVAFLSYACYLFETPYTVKVNVASQGVFQMKKRRTTVRQMSTEPLPAESQYPAAGLFDTPDEIELTGVMNSAGQLVELIFNRAIDIPRTLIKIIGLCIPFHQHLNRLTIRWGPLSTVGLYEFSKLLLVSKITEICLDDSPVPGRNYEVLLERTSHLRYLSLSRCKLDDIDCLKLAALLVNPQPASKTLNILILVSNRIGDKGACALGQVLRSNRSLQCLNLAGNRITDSGAKSIFRSLMDFPLTTDELLEAKKRHLEYLRLKREVYTRCLKKSMKTDDENRLTKLKTITRVQRKPSANLITNSAILKAEAKSIERFGLFIDPFSSDQRVCHAGQVYCIGNTVLCYLNLSFNNLEFASLLSLYQVLTHQSWLGSKIKTGLLHVNIEGNNLPLYCDELFLIDDLLDRAQESKTKQVARNTDKGKIRQSSRVKIFK